MRNLRSLLFVLLALIPLIYLAYVWAGLPDIVPLQYSGSDFKPSRMGPKSEMAIGVLILCGANIFTYLLLTNIQRIDPKRADAGKSAVFAKLAAGLVFFLAALGLLIVIATAHPGTRLMEIALFPLIGLLFMFLGNYIYSVKPNYFVGIRTPWALADETNWKKTHQMGGRLFFWGGLAVLLSGLFIPSAAQHVLLFFVIATVVITFGYSYMVFKQQQKTQA